MDTIDPVVQARANLISHIYWTPTEGRIVALLLERREPMSAAMIAADLRRRSAGAEAVIAVMIRNIRLKLARYAVPYRISCIKRRGYLLNGGDRNG